MKLLASALSLILVGLTGIWLWFDATAQARQDLPGVVVTADQDPGAPAVRQPDADSDADGDTASAAPTDPVDDPVPADTAATTDDPTERTTGARETLDSRMVALSSVLGTLRASRGDLSDLAAAAAEQAQMERDEADKAAAELSLIHI